MTEVPDYLLQRSRERRSALGLETGAEGAAAPVPATTTSAAAADAAPAVAKAAPTPAPVEDVPPPVVPDKPWVAAAKERKKIPVWMAPVAIFLPMWAFMWYGTLEEPPREAVGPVAAGGEHYSSCAGCHGAGGGGGVGPQLNGGEVLLTFPDVASQVAWVINGSPAASGTAYGDPNRPGGGRVSAGGMPAFAGEGTAWNIEVVLYERVTHGGQPEPQLEGWIAWVESGALPEYEGGVLPQTIQADYDAFLAENPDIAEAVAAAEAQ